MDRRLVSIVFVVVASVLSMHQALADGELATTNDVIDEQCKHLLIEYFDKIKISSKVQDFVVMIRSYYKHKNPYYHELAVTADGCEEVKNKINNIQKNVGCSKHLMGPETSEGRKILINISERSKDVMEAYYACRFNAYAFWNMQQDAVGDEYIQRAKNGFDAITWKLKKRVAYKLDDLAYEYITPIREGGQAAGELVFGRRKS